MGLEGIRKRGSTARALGRQRAQFLARSRSGGWPVRRSMKQVDAKYHDIAVASYQCDTTGSVTHLDVVPQGTTVNTREGKAFMPTSINIRGYLVAGVTAVFNDYAIMYVWDRQPNKGAFVIGDLLDTPTPGSQNKRENQSRFQVIRRFDGVLMGKGDGSTTGDFGASFDHYIKLPKGLVAQCTTADTTGAIANRISGALFQVTVGNNAAGTTACFVNNTMRINFVDV